MAKGLIGTVAGCDRPAPNGADHDQRDTTIMNDCPAPTALQWPRHFFQGIAAALILVLAACDQRSGSHGLAESEKPMRAEEVRPKAEQGDAQAQTALGKILLEGRGARPDYTEAAQWLRKAADQGSAEAQFFLAGLYEAGRGVASDLSEAVRWNLKAAEAGHADAQYALALLYATGKGTPKDRPASVKWFRAAAEQGLTEAQFNLAQRYQHGQGVETNLAEAYKWFTLAAKQGLPDAVKESLPIKAELTSAQIVEAEKFAATFVARKFAPAPRP